MLDPITLDAAKAVTAYPTAIATARWKPLGTAGGFSGARLWHGVAADGRKFALKVHPTGADVARLENIIHRWMITARQVGLDFVPAVERTRAGRTVVEAGGRLWDVIGWMPGKADFHDDPSDFRLVAAVTALARIHTAWAAERSIGPCPAIERRWQAFIEWEKLVASGWRPDFDSADPVRSAAESAWSVLPRVTPVVQPAIMHWLPQSVLLQPCLCDIWHDHVLFDGDRVSGIIDFAAAKVDHVAVDLARLLGSLIPDQQPRTDSALAAYTAIRPLPQPELVPLLDRTGTIVAVINWLRWLYHDGREYPNRNVVAERLTALTKRLGGFGFC
ncbi:MAG TPA: phosphotransferase [Gemmataceae bacterium]|nr:phosphotransferase [Gemmataceae bacterium]